MRIENAEEPLKSLAKRVYSIAKWLDGNDPGYHEGNGWYQSGSPIFLYFRIVGAKARKYPPHTVHVIAKQTELLAELNPMVGNNLWGPDFSAIAHPGNEREFAYLLEFIGRAYCAAHPV